MLAFYGLVGRLLDLLRPRRIVGQIVDHAARAIREAYPFALRDAPSPAAAEYPPVTTVVRHEGRPGVCPRSIARASCGPRRRPEP